MLHSHQSLEESPWSSHWLEAKQQICFFTMFWFQKVRLEPLCLQMAEFKAACICCYQKPRWKKRPRWNMRKKKAILISGFKKKNHFMLIWCKTYMHLCTWRSEDNLGPGLWTQVARLGCKCLYLLSYLAILSVDYLPIFSSFWLGEV